MSLAFSARRLSLSLLCKRAKYPSNYIAGLATCTRSPASCDGTSTIKAPEPSLVHHDLISSGHNVNTCGLTRNGTSLCGNVSSLSSLLEELTVNTSLVPEGQQDNRKEKYILPTVSNYSEKKILDPDTVHQRYELPTLFNEVQEKLTPGLESFVPKIDPDPLQRVIDEGSMPLVKVTMPYLLRIRRHKMKKHKLKKFRKRMIYLHRKLAEIKKRKKEQQLVEYKHMWEKRGEEFDPEKFVQDRLLLARKGGYGVPLFQGKSKR